nr:zinc finger, CCHC-type [Tanacetum cinerariifolium]
MKGRRPMRIKGYASWDLGHRHMGVLENGVGTNWVRFYVIESNEYVSINSIIELRDEIFDKNRFSSIPGPKDVIPNLNESQRDDHSDDVPSEIPKPWKGKRVQKAKSHEAIDDEIGYIMENNTWVLSDLPYDCKPLGCKWIFKRKTKVDGTIEKFKARLVIQGFRQNEGIYYFDTYASIARIITIRLLLALVATHNLVIHQMDVKTTFLNGDLEEVYMKQPEGFVMPDNEHKVCKLVKSLWVFFLGGGVISWASKKQTCVTIFTMESEFVALTATGKEEEWLRNLIHEIPIWPKPIAPISICYDSAPTMARAYSQIYNGKSRHLCVRHSMIRKLIMKGKSRITLKWGGFVGDLSVINGHLVLSSVGYTTGSTKQLILLGYITTASSV